MLEVFTKGEDMRQIDHGIKITPTFTPPTLDKKRAWKEETSHENCSLAATLTKGLKHLLIDWTKPVQEEFLVAASNLPRCLGHFLVERMVYV